MQRTSCGALIGIVSCAAYSPALPAAQGEWPYVGGDAGGSRYSSLEQIDTHNVGKLTRAELWSDHLSAAAFAAPMTYQSSRSGRQFVVVAVGGNNHFGANDGLYLQAYALPPAP